jgi:hypothetical protein
VLAACIWLCKWGLEVHELETLADFMHVGEPSDSNDIVDRVRCSMSLYSVSFSFSPTIRRIFMHSEDMLSPKLSPNSSPWSYPPLRIFLPALPIPKIMVLECRKETSKLLSLPFEHQLLEIPRLQDLLNRLGCLEANHRCLVY